MKVKFRKDKKDIQPPFDNLGTMNLNTLPRIDENVSLKNTLYVVKKIITRYDYVNNEIEGVEVYISENGSYNDPSYILSE